MKQNNQQRATANKIKKWIQATSDVEKARFAIPITRLTSIKSLCVDEIAAAKFALYIAKRVQQQLHRMTCPEHFTEAEWEQQQQLVDEAISLMESYLENPIAILNDFLCICVLMDFGKIKFMFLGEKLK